MQRLFSTYSLDKAAEVEQTSLPYIPGIFLSQIHTLLQMTLVLLTPSEINIILLIALTSELFTASTEEHQPGILEI